MEEKTPLSHKVVCFQMHDFETSKLNSEVFKYNLWKITSFSKTMPFLTMFYMVEQLPIACYQVRFYANNYFGLLPIVSTVKLFNC